MSNEPMTQQEQDALRAALAELEGDQPTQRGRFRALRRGTRSWTGPALFRNAGAREISDLGVCDHFTIFKAFPSKVDTIARK
jgi:hypothetical protein